MNLQDNIARMEKELADMKKQLEQQNKLELKGGEGFVLQALQGPLYGNTSVFKGYLYRGAFRATKELADIANKNMVARNRLEAYAMQLDPEWEADWDTNKFDKCYIYFDYEIHTYLVKYSQLSKPIGTVMMSEETAEILCEKLNAKEIEL